MQAQRVNHPYRRERFQGTAPLPPDPEWLNTREKAAQCRVSESTLYRWQEAGLLKSRKIGGRTLWPAAMPEAEGAR